MSHLQFPRTILALIALTLCTALSAMATTPCTTVNSTDDSSAAATTAGTLRYAIAQANAGTCDTIGFSLSYPATITLAQGQLEISNNVTISGPGAANLAIDGANASRVFQINSSTTVSISGVTVENGIATDDVGGGIYNYQGRLTVTNATFSGNSATNGGGIFTYAGLFNPSASATVTNTTFSGNSASSFGGGIYNEGGTLTVSNSTFSGNSAYDGGGILNNSSTATVTNSTFSGNSVADGGGAIFNYSSTATVTNSTFSTNSAATGGGIFNNSSPATVTNSTFSGNSASSGDGGGGIFNDFGHTTVKNTLLASSSGGNCANINSGTLSSSGYNLSDDNSCTTYFNQTGDVNNTAAGLDSGGLKDNGGPTKTIALTATSAALDKIPVSACTDANGNALATDQRGVARPQNTNCDIGAFELVQSVAFSTFTAKLNIATGGLQPGFNLNAAFTLGASTNGINPRTESVTLTVGSYTVTIPAGSFKLLTNGAKKGSWTYSGVINGVSLSVQIAPTTTANSYTFAAAGNPVTPATSNPVTVTITIKDDTGTKSVNAKFL